MFFFFLSDKSCSKAEPAAVSIHAKLHNELPICSHQRSRRKFNVNAQHEHIFHTTRNPEADLCEEACVQDCVLTVVCRQEVTVATLVCVCYSSCCVYSFAIIKSVLMQTCTPAQNSQHISHCQLVSFSFLTGTNDASS